MNAEYAYTMHPDLKLAKTVVASTHRFFRLKLSKNGPAYISNARLLTFLIT